ncbi:hypothetical protein WJX77_009919 [Trebouxia sp. C0004]
MPDARSALNGLTDIMASARQPLNWDDRITSVRTARFRVAYQKLDLAHSQVADSTSSRVDETQLAAYCEAVKRLISQGIGEGQAVQVMKLCGGDLDAAELWIGVCSSVGLISICDPSDTSESWVWEGIAGHLYLAPSLFEVVKRMKVPESQEEFAGVADVLENTSNAVTMEMQQEVTQFEVARQLTEKPCAIGLSVQDILTRLEASSGIARSKVVAIEEILNPIVWDQYNKQKQCMVEPNERWLFHGSGPENIAHIAEEGFDLRLANPRGQYGSGVYFASHSSTSLQFTTKDALKAMGGVPVRTQQRRSDSVGGSTMHVIYKSEQAYPRYMVFFRP